MKNNLYFPALDGLRFFAFFWVFLGHLPRPDSIFSWFQKTNWIGVDIFFALSAFLITVLLLKEFDMTNKISFKSFLIRRTLRLIPLYIFVVLLGGLIFPYMNYDIGPSLDEIAKHLPMYFLMIANVTVPIIGEGGTGNVLSPLWSIMVEFQFYILIVPIIAFIIKRNKSKYLIHFAVGLLLFSLLYRYLINDPKYIYGLLFGRLDSFAGGIFLGYIYFKEISIENSKVDFFILAGSIILFYIVSKIGHPMHIDTNILVYSISALASLLFIYSTLKLKIINTIFSFNIFIQLGKISFGLYVFHTLGIHIALSTKIPFLNELYSAVCIALFFTIGISIVSFYTLEKYFLNFKNKYETIHHNSKEVK